MAAAAFLSCPATTPMASSARLAPTRAFSSSSSVFFSAAGSGRTALAWTALVVGRRAPVHRRIGGLGCHCMFGLGVPELAVIAGVAALVFGPTKLPEIGRSFGKTIKSFQEAAKEFETELKKGPEESPPAEHSKAFINEDENEEQEISGTKNNA